MNNDNFYECYQLLKQKDNDWVIVCRKLVSIIHGQQTHIEQLEENHQKNLKRLEKLHNRKK